MSQWISELSLELPSCSPENRMELLKIVLTNSLEGVVVTDLKASILWVNPAFTKITGYALAEAVGKNPRILKSGRHEPEFYSEMWNALKQNGQWEGEILNRRKSGEVYPEYLKIYTLRDSSGTPLKYVAILNDTTYLKEFEQNMRFQLALARKIQTRLLPLALPENFSGIHTAALYLPMEQIGGDFYDLLNIPDTGDLGIFISDISGHGVPAALVTSMVKTSLDSAGSKKQSPGELLGYMNHQLLRLTDEFFLTAFYGVYHPETRALTYSRAGHPYPVVIRNRELIFLNEPGSLMLGVFEEIGIKENRIILETGDKVIFYTDGVIEAISPQGEEFEEQFYLLLRQSCFASLESLIQEIHEKLVLHVGKDSFEDDVCILVMEIR